MKGRPVAWVEANGAARTARLIAAGCLLAMLASGITAASRVRSLANDALWDALFVAEDGARRIVVAALTLALLWSALSGPAMRARIFGMGGLLLLQAQADSEAQLERQLLVLAAPLAAWLSAPGLGVGGVAHRLAFSAGVALASADALLGLPGQAVSAAGVLLTTAALWLGDRNESPAQPTNHSLTLAIVGGACLAVLLLLPPVDGWLRPILTESWGPNPFAPVAVVLSMLSLRQHPARALVVLGIARVEVPVFAALLLLVPWATQWSSRASESKAGSLVAGWNASKDLAQERTVR